MSCDIRELCKKYLEVLDGEMCKELDKKEEDDKYSSNPEFWITDQCKADKFMEWFDKEYKSKETSEKKKPSAKDSFYVHLVKHILKETKTNTKKHGVHDGCSSSLFIDSVDKKKNSKAQDVSHSILIADCERGNSEDEKNTEERYSRKWLHEKKKKKTHLGNIAVALVTKEHLKLLDDPLRTSLKLAVAICEEKLWIMPQLCKALLDVPKKFVEGLLENCMSLTEIEVLMDIEDKNVLIDLQAGKFYDIVAIPAYKKLYLEKVFWKEQVHYGFLQSLFLSFLKRLMCLVLWNILYPFKIAYYKVIKKKKQESIHHRLFTPISCFIADIVNYFIMTFLICFVLLHLNPDQKSTIDLISQYRQGNVTLDHPRLSIGTVEGIIKVELEKNPFSLRLGSLLLCLISRIIIEFNQLFNNLPHELHEGSRKYEMCGGNVWCGLWDKIKTYFKSDLNKVDVVMIVILSLAFGYHFHYCFSTPSVYGSVCDNNSICDETLDFTIETRRVVYMTNLYSVALLLTLVRLFHGIFLFIPIVGPIVESMRGMMKDVFKVVMIMTFFSVGFFIPLFAIIQCYITVHQIKADENHVFQSMDTPVNGLFTMILSIMEGKLTYSEDIYEAEDEATKFFFFIFMIFYFLIFGLLCINLLIALISNRYSKMMENKNENWKFSQFTLIVDYLAQKKKMPFLFPFSLLYFFFRICPCGETNTEMNTEMNTEREKLIKRLMKRKENAKDKDEDKDKVQSARWC